MKLWKYTFVLLILILAILVLALFQIPDSRFHLIACDVGQGDATLIIYKNLQILTDGGPDKSVLSCLGKYLPFWDREIELVILTHPDKDHFAGLIDVFKRYKVDNYLYNPIKISSSDYQVLEKEAGGRGINSINPYTGQVLRVGMIYLDTLNPNGEAPVSAGGQNQDTFIPDAATNAYSIVSLARFGNFRALLTGDITPEVSDDLSAKWPGGSLDYIKIPHHGSKNGLTENLLKALMPKLATISVGKNNRYGHPAPEILEMLKKYGIKTLRTDETGDIEVVTDGKNFRLND